jgi:hypothetical protein
MSCQVPLRMKWNRADVQRACCCEVHSSLRMKWNRADVQRACCCEVHSSRQLLLLSCQLQALLQTCDQLSTLQSVWSSQRLLPICRQLQAAADACGLAGSSVQATAASRCEQNVDPCSLASRHLGACKGFAQMHFNLQSALCAAW